MRGAITLALVALVCLNNVSKVQETPVVLEEHDSLKYDWGHDGAFTGQDMTSPAPNRLYLRSRARDGLLNSQVV